MSIKDRIKQLIDYKRISVMAFEKSVGLSNGYLRNTASISADNCAKILTAYPEVSADWLMLGHGEMERPSMQCGDISNSTVSGVNVSGREIHLADPSANSTLLEIVSGFQRTTERQFAQMDELIAILKTKI